MTQDEDKQNTKTQRHCHTLRYSTTKGSIVNDDIKAYVINSNVSELCIV